MLTAQLSNSPPRWFRPRNSALIYQAGERKVWKVDDEFIPKRTPVTGHNAEAATHKFIEERTMVPVPHVYGEWLSPDRRHHYLLEGRIAGQTLADCWAQLDIETKVRLAQQVVEHMERLARFMSSAMQSLAGGRLPNNCFVPVPSDAGDAAHRAHLSGRWRTGSEAFNHGFRPALESVGVPAHVIELAARTMPPCSGQLVLTHADLYIGNVMVDSRRGAVTAIIDWESAGFWPAWFQYALHARVQRRRR
jgi:hypothetical protein